MVDIMHINSPPQAPVIIVFMFFGGVKIKKTLSV